MRASTEEFLYDLWYMADTLLRPSWHNVLSPDFESWAWRNGLTRRLAQLEKQKLLEQQTPRTIVSRRIVRLTEAGRLVVLGGRDPLACWARSWDAQWRLVLFDLPIDAQALRIKLHRLLRARHFGFLQGSAWITPDPISDVRAAIAEVPVDPENFVVFAGRPVSGETDAAIVAGGWDFTEINRRYDRHLDVLRTVPTKGGAQLRTWLHRENAAWKYAVQFDPLLPLALLPADYRGRTAWSTRAEVLPTVARQLR
jgi:DNA-binding transcriptional regulator PaaX